MQTLIEEQQQWESTCNCQCNEFIPRLLSAEKKLGNVSDETRTMTTAELRDWANTHHQELEEIKRNEEPETMHLMQQIQPTLPPILEFIHVSHIEGDVVELVGQARGL